MQFRILMAVMQVASLGLAGAGGEAAGADAYPQRSIRLIVPYPPGGAGDIVGRLLSPRLGESLGQQVVIDNRGGGGQLIATEIAAKAPADGYTLFLASATHGINPGLQKKLPYDTIRDFCSEFIAIHKPGDASIPSITIATKCRGLAPAANSIANSVGMKSSAVPKSGSRRINATGISVSTNGTSSPVRRRKLSRYIR